MRKSLILVAVLLCALFGQRAAYAGDPVPIGTIMTDPDPYQSRLDPVTIQGRVRNLNILPPYNSKCGPTYNAFTLKLDDGTGSIVVESAGNCRDPQSSLPFANGDLLVVEGQVKVLLDKEGDDRVIISIWKVTRVGK